MARVLTFDPTDDPTTVDFWVKKLQNALHTRRALGLLDHPELTDCYRLVHAEGDGLPGLVIDIYGKTAVVQCHSVGMHRQNALIASALCLLFEGKLTAVFDKSRESLPPKYAATIQNYRGRRRKIRSFAAARKPGGHL